MASTKKPLNRSSPTMDRAQKVIETTLSNRPGIKYVDIISACVSETPCARSTAQDAMRELSAQGHITIIGPHRRAHEYYWESKPKPIADAREFSESVYQKVIRVEDAPRIVGARLSPLEWAVKTLEAAI
jgi:hypothetical protein